MFSSAKFSNPVCNWFWKILVSLSNRLKLNKESFKHIIRMLVDQVSKTNAFSVSNCISFFLLSLHHQFPQNTIVFMYILTIFQINNNQRSIVHWIREK